jgi:hypothetical protein
MTKILSETIYINKSNNIEDYLAQNYGEVVRWAIVEVNDNDYKVTFSYEIKEAQTN